MSPPADDPLRAPSPDLADLERRRLWVRFLAGDPLSVPEQEKLIPGLQAGGPAGPLVEDEALHRALTALGQAGADGPPLALPVRPTRCSALDAERFTAAVDRRIEGRLHRSRGRRLVAAVAAGLGAAAVAAFWLGRTGSGQSSGLCTDPQPPLATTAPPPDPASRFPGATAAARGNPAPSLGIGTVARPQTGAMPERGPAPAARSGPGARSGVARGPEGRARSVSVARAGGIATAVGRAEPGSDDALSESGGSPPGTGQLLKLAEALRLRGRLPEATAIQSRLLRQHALAWDPPAPAVYRINAGGPRYVDPAGNVWSADTLYTGGRTFSAARPVAGTALEPLYQTERNGVGSPISYELPLASGSYVVLLHFAEIYGGINPGNARRFDVLIEKERVLEGYDISSDVGPGTAVIRPFVAEVNDGALTIDLTHVSENPKLSALEIYPLPTGASPPPQVLQPPAGHPRPPVPGLGPRAVYRINAGGPAFEDPEGNLWSADSFSNGGVVNRTRTPIAGTDRQALYRNERFAPDGARLVYELPVENGAYAVHLHFAEIYPPTALSGRRVFDVFLEGTPVLRGFDISAEVGAYTAVVKPFVTEVRDGRLAIELRPLIENAKVSGIEVFALGPGASPPSVVAAPPLPLAPSDALYRINAGAGEYIDPQGGRWEPDGYSNDAGRGVEQEIEILATDLDPLYQSQRWTPRSSGNLVYSFPVDEGEYLLRLHFAEINAAMRAPGKRVFDVLVEKSEALSHLDVAATAGFGTALVKELRVAVIDGALDVELRPVAGGATRIAALEVIPLPTARSADLSRSPIPESVAAPAAAVQPSAGCTLAGGRPPGPGWPLLVTLSWLMVRRRRWRAPRLRDGRRPGR